MRNRDWELRTNRETFEIKNKISLISHFIFRKGGKTFRK